MKREITDHDVDVALNIAVPGGSKASWWFTEHGNPQAEKNIRDVVRFMLESLQLPEEKKETVYSKDFEDWFFEIENFSMRCERFDSMLESASAAWDAGTELERERRLVRVSY